MQESNPPWPIRFGVFEVDLPAGQLRRQGSNIKLQEQPLQVLAVLLDRPGEVVTREELQKRLWPADTFVDFERGLNRAINKLREALGDDADNPRFIQTLPRRGYRFLAPVEKSGPPKLDPEPDSHGTAPVLDLPNPIVPPAQRRVLPWILAGLLALVASWSLLRTPPSGANRPFLQLELDAGHDGFSQPAISSDGMRIAFVSKGGLAMRRLDQAKLMRLAGTEGASYPFFSPDGRWVAFFAGGKLQKVALEGGEVVSLCSAPGASGANWGEDDTIVAALSDGLFEVSAAGGMLHRLTDSGAEPSGKMMIHRWPQVLPGGQGVLFADTNGSWQGSLRVLLKSSGKVKTIVENSTHGRFLAGGYIVYLQRGTLFAAALDTSTMELTSLPVALVQGVSTSADRADFDVSRNGTLIYRGDSGGPNFTVAWLHSSGRIEPVIAKPAKYLTPRLSPDSSRLAVAIVEEEKQNLWVYDFGREVWSRVTNGADPDMLPTWTPDGEFIAFRSGDALAWTRWDGSGKVERLEGVSPNAGPWSFSADGKWLAFWPLERGSDLWVAAVERAPGVLRLKYPERLRLQAGTKGAPAISPDGRWLAYTSDESGHFEVYVSPFSPKGAADRRKWPVSTAGGWAPVWAPMGGELLYQNSDRQVFAAAYRVKGDSFTPQKPRLWSDTRLGATGFLDGFDVARDGKRVLALMPAEDPRASTLVRALLNVDTELHRRLTSGQPAARVAPR
jgi:DNA-binding winged helix-turn-helix (wHTH) protein/Tol biopolymer transport system component